MRKCMATAGRSGRVLSKYVVEVCVVDASRVACGCCKAVQLSITRIACVGDDRLLSDS